ncbi:MAG: filamentation induced by camp protein fic [Fusobacteria bacterium]|nr:MAG: filamentation induced by camp protein fic [Fusobacteriota bacterium]KAF0229140.1 MAG: filamentation induced by camp protein [Fusobacteriota bacterium]
MNTQKLPILPPDFDLETKTVLKHLAKANRALAELKGYVETIPNKHILINGIMINEAKDSSAIENIITTHDDLYKAISKTSEASHAAKEVVSYRTALWHGFQLVKERQLLTNNMIIEIQSIIESNKAGIRKLPGTVLRNDRTGETVYTPPVGEAEIISLLGNLEKYINEDNNEDIDPLIKMAVIHYQFESIHPFYDGNGRTGRIINVLYLILMDLLDSPILYLSGYINRNKSDYYRLLQEVRNINNWEDWISYILVGVEETAVKTLSLAKKINSEVATMSEEIKMRLPKIYSKELLELLFFEFYTKTIYIQQGLSVSRRTAVSYLSSLENEGFLISEKIGKERIYQNKSLYDLFRYEQ